MLLKVVVFLSVLSLCHCGALARKGGGAQVLFGGGLLTYLAFLIIKIKTVLVIGTIIAGVLITGKVLAFLKYLELKKSEPEKIYIGSPHDTSPYSSHEGGIVFDNPYAGGFAANGFEKYSPDFEGYQTHRDGGRSNDEGYGIFDGLSSIGRMIEKLNISEIAFNSMRIKSDECRKKFVCQVDFASRFSLILKRGLDLFIDDGYLKYRSEEKVASLDDCTKLHPECKKEPTT